MEMMALKEKFLQFKDYEATDANELLDFTKLLYMNGDLSISEFRKIVKKLEEDGASNPDQLQVTSGSHS
ncbi:YppF family protein [Metabacillus herbersteinensis]|uniref:YppF family protein n=1 Tax=Metabacillus herbersteinensis TaxID=283816 RepID=A0ABV6GDW5_9BACI